MALTTLGARPSVMRISTLFGGFDGAGALRTSELRDVASMKPNKTLQNNSISRLGKK